MNGRSVPSELLELDDIVAKMAHELVIGGRVVHRQLLASRFYEAIKTELDRTPRSCPVLLGVLAASADQCRRSAANGVSPRLMLVELSAALAMLTSGGMHRSQALDPTARPQFRVIQVGLA